MTKKDFQLIADVLKSSRDDLNFSAESTEVINRVASNFAAKLQTINPRFRTNTFLKAAGM